MDIAWKLPVSVFIWDLYIWAGHVLLHKVPGLYSRYLANTTG
jgi:hypothetical protein